LALDEEIQLKTAHFNLMFYFFCLIFLALGVYMLGMGLWGIVRKKPFLFASKNTFWFTVLSFVPGMILPIQGLWQTYAFSAERSEAFDWSLSIPFLLPLLMYPVLLAFYWRLLRGYTVLGVTDDSFRQALYSVLKDLQLPFEERLSKLRLTSLDADLEANVSSRMGAASIRIKQKEHQEILDKIATGLQGYFSGSHVSINMVTCVYYIIFGVLMVTFAGFFSYFALTQNLS
jgi:hypothetical protein